MIFLSFNYQETYAQDEQPVASVDSKYYNEIVPSDFETVFRKDEDKKNFKKLREYLGEKENLLEALKEVSDNFKDSRGAIPALNKKIATINDLVQGKTDTDVIKIDEFLLYTTSVDYDKNGVSVGEINLGLNDLRNNLKDLQSDSSQSKNITQNSIIIKRDIYTTQNQIDSALAPEYKQQEFRITISICFTVLIGLLLSLFFFIVYKKSDNNLSRDLLSGYGLQFITLFVLIIAIILFGILSILGSSELAAILSGISGYILGKGIQKDEGKTAASKDNDKI
jgi:membrane-associated HD superfamily phosphohydrolase